jgi:hypothetical protein
MMIQILSDGTLRVPVRLEKKGMIGDSIMTIATDHPDYPRYHAQYERERQLGWSLPNASNDVAHQ